MPATTAPTTRPFHQVRGFAGRSETLVLDLTAGREEEVVSVNAETTAFYEIRRYQAYPGRRDELVRVMENVVIPFVESRGMTVTGSFVDEQDANGYIWIRRFDNEASRVLQYTAVYDDAQWISRISGEVLGLMDREKAVITRAVPTGRSPLL